MKKIIYILAAITLATSELALSQQSNPTPTRRYPFSWSGAKDLACAYGLAWGLTACHELGHATMAKLAYGNCVVGVSLGSYDFNPQGIAINGLNPYAGRTNVSYPSPTPLKDALINMAGPICGAASSLLAYALIKSKPNLYLTKICAAGIFLTSTIGTLYEASLEGSDGYLFIQNIQKHCNE